MLISDDEYHEDFWKHSPEHLRNYIKYDTDIHVEKDNRRMNRFIVPLGRAKKNELYSLHDNRERSTDCSDSMYTSVNPNGDVSIASCGMQNIGNINYHSEEELRARLYKQSEGREDWTMKKCLECSYYTEVYSKEIAMPREVRRLSVQVS